jgi:hypothetical protein
VCFRNARSLHESCNIVGKQLDRIRPVGLVRLAGPAKIDGNTGEVLRVLRCLKCITG